MNPKIIVFTSVVGDRDALRADQVADGAEFVAFVDRPRNTPPWSERRAYHRLISPRRNSRAPKILPHQFIETEYSLWLDAGVALRVAAVLPISEWMHRHDLVVFRHPVRSCSYDEAAVCAERNLDRPEVIAEQSAAYRRRGFRPGLGLAECRIIFRRHTRAVEKFNEYWWSEHCRHSVRDQISFMYAAERAGVSLRILEVNPRDHPYFSLRRQKAQPEFPV